MDLDMKQVIGTAMITIVLICTLLGIGGMWGMVESEVAWRVFGTLVVVAVGLGVAAKMIGVFFP